jgi:ATP-dependent helicase/DNAse subunit B
MLERVYQRVQDEGLTIEPEHTERAVEILHDVADDLLWNAPQRLGFRASTLWKHEARVILRKLEALIRTDFSGIGPLTRTFGDEPRRPYRLETSFGIDGHAALELGGETLKVQGYIDRMDRQGNRVIITDYKTGSAPIQVSEMEQGRNFQMMLYLLAAQQLLAEDSSPGAPTEVAGGLFWHIGTRKASGEILLDDAGAEAVNLAREHLIRYLALGRRGDFAARANKMKDGKCAHYCEFREMCRVSIMNRHKS